MAGVADVQGLRLKTDPGFVAQPARDLMFRRFIGLGLGEGVPGHSGILAVPHHAGQARLAGRHVVRSQPAKGLDIKAGEVSIVGAAVIEAKQSRPRKVKDGENAQAGEAGYNVKVAANEKETSIYGYKAHINMDKDGFMLAAMAYNIERGVVVQAEMPMPIQKNWS